MRQTETAAEGVAEFVMEGNVDQAQHHAGEPGAVQRRAARLQIRRLGDDFRQAGGQCAQALLSHQRGDGIGVFGIERFDRMGHGIDAACARRGRRQTQR